MDKFSNVYFLSEIDFLFKHFKMFVSFKVLKLKEYNFRYENVNS